MPSEDLGIAENGDFDGCVSGAAIDSSSILVNFEMPAGAIQMDIQRDGASVFKSELTTLLSHTDSGLSQGRTYTYSCLAKFKTGKIQRGRKILTLSTPIADAPTFAGIRTATFRAETEQVFVTWGATSGTPARSYKVFVSEGNSINWDALPVAVVQASAGRLSAAIDANLFPPNTALSFGVRACAYDEVLEEDICDANNVAKTITIQSTRAGVTGILAPAAATYVAGENLDFTVQFSEPVTVTGALPTLSLVIGSSARSAAFVSGSGTSNLLFRYTVVSGDNDLDGVYVASPLQLGTGAIVAGDGRGARVGFVSPTLSDVQVDTIAPSPLAIAVPGNRSYGSGENLDFALQFSEPVVVSGAPRLTLVVGSTTRYATLSSGAGTSTLIFRYLIQPGENDPNGISLANSVDLNGGTITDSVGNASSLVFSSPNLTQVRVDSLAPTITNVAAPPFGTYRFGQALNFSVTFSEPVFAVGGSEIGVQLDTGSRSAVYVSGSGTSTLVYRYTIQDTDNDVNGLALTSPIGLTGGTLKDEAGNDAVRTFSPPSTTGILIDNIGPAVTGVAVPTNGIYLPGQNLDFVVTFEEGVVVTGSPRIPLQIGATSTYATYASGSTTTQIRFRHTVQVGEETGAGVVLGNTIELNAGTIKDSDGVSALLPLANVPGTTNVRVDGVGPTGVIPVVVETPYWKQQYATPNLSFSDASISDAVSGLPTPRVYKVAIGTGTSGNALNNVRDWADASPNVSFAYSTSVNFASDGQTYYVNLRSQDANGNWSAVASSPIYADRTPPQGLTITSPVDGGSVASGFTVSGTCEYRVEGGNTITLTYGPTGHGITAGTASCQSNGQFTSTANAAGSAGAGKTLKISQTDRAGNASETSEITFTVTVPKQVFTANGEFEVPNGVTSLNIRVWGGGGGAGGAGGVGGGGGFVSHGSVTVTPGEKLLVSVGGGGSRTTVAGVASGGSNGGGNGRSRLRSTVPASGGGGGYSEVKRLDGTRLLLAGGGGGGSGTTCTGGGGGTPSFLSTAAAGSGSGMGTYCSGGTGATNSAAGSGAAVESNGSFLLGGNADSSLSNANYQGGGGGGGGYYGGGGGTSAYDGCGSGGGGSNYADVTLQVSASTSRAAGTAAAGNADPNYVSGHGVGGVESAGGGGLVVITW